MKILIADDIEDARIILKKTLESDGYSVEAASNGSEALRMAKESPPDMIVSDILMPEMDGFELCRLVKEDKQLRKIPFIFYTATYVDPKDERLAISLGASRYILKPIERAEFLNIIKEVIQEYKEKKLVIPEKPVEGKPELFRMYEKSLREKLDKKVKELEKGNRALRESEARFKSVIDNVEFGVSLISPAMEVLLLNRQMKKWFPDVDVSQKPICYKVFQTPPGNEICSYCPTHKTLSDGNVHEVFTDTTLGQKIKHSRIISSPIRDEKGKVTAAVEIIEDITNRKQAEKELKKLREHLEELVKARTGELQKKTAELERANIQLKELDRLKSMFIASMSHELRTPLNSIIGFTGIILQGVTGDINEEQKKQLTMVKNSANHLLELINDIIDLSKIEAGMIELFIDKFDLSSLMKEVNDSFKVAAAEKDLNLTFKMPKRLSIKSSKRRTKKILENLVNNAIKFTDRGEIEIKVVKEDRSVEISVRDTGIGIKKEDMDKLFKAFSQIRDEGRQFQEGTGLGLYLSKKLTDLLGGEIRAESEFGKGSEFTFTLPLESKEVST